MKNLHNIQVNTADNVPVDVKADVFYEITDPDLALRSLEDINTAVVERAENALASVFMHHSLKEISPISLNIDAKIDSQQILNIDEDSGKRSKHAPVGINNIVREFVAALSTNLSKVGIKLLNVGINSLTITDKALQKEMGQQAVTWATTAAAFQMAENNKKITITTAEGAAQSVVLKAQAEADAARVRAQGFVDAGKIINEAPFAKQMMFFGAQKEIASAANTVVYPMDLQTPPQFALPLSPTR